MARKKRTTTKAKSADKNDDTSSPLISPSPEANESNGKTQVSEDEDNSNESSDNNVPKQENQLPTPSLNKGPKKRVAGRIHVGRRTKKQSKQGQRDSRMTMKVEGYAFKDDIIGVRHLRSDREDGFNYTLRNMVLENTLADKGFTYFATLRDKNSGKDDDHLYGKDGYPCYMFMCLGVHAFADAKEAAPAVLEQCRLLREVSTSCSNYTHCLQWLQTYHAIVLFSTGSFRSNAKYLQLYV